MEGIAPVQHLTGLTNLTIEANANRHILPDFLWTLTSLRRLRLAYSNVTSLPNAFGDLKNLEYLDLTAFESLVDLPASIGNLTALRSFCLMEPLSLRLIPESIGNLTALELFWIPAYPSLHSLLESIGNVHALKILVINCSSQTLSIPESFADLVLNSRHRGCSLEIVFHCGWNPTNISSMTKQALELIQGRALDLRFEIGSVCIVAL